jgi:hypothetical protein
MHRSSSNAQEPFIVHDWGCWVLRLVELAVSLRRYNPMWGLNIGGACPQAPPLKIQLNSLGAHQSMLKMALISFKK